MTDQLTQADLSMDERRELLALVAVLAGLRWPREQVLEAMGRVPMIRQILEDSSIAQGWWSEGYERGRQEGWIEGQRELARLALEGRFGTLPADEEAALGAADTETLRAIGVHLASDSREQVRTRLGLT